MLQDLRLNNGKPPEYVSPKYIARYLGRDTEYVKKCHVLDGITYRVTMGGYKEYKWREVFYRIKHLAIEPAPKVHPNARFTQEEIIADLDIHNRTYLRHVRAGHIKETVIDGRKYVLLKDYDWFRRNYCVRELVGRMDPTVSLTFNETALLFGIKAKSLMTNSVKPGRLTFTKKGKYASRKFSKDAILALLDLPDFGPRHEFRKSPMPESLPSKLAVLYAKMTPKYLSWLRTRKLVTIDPNKSRNTMVDSLEKVYQRNWALRAYGDGSKYYTRQQIKNKFLVNDLWISQYIIGKCRVIAKDGKTILTDEELHELYPGMTSYKMIYLRGWVKEDVDAVYASGCEAIPDIIPECEKEAKNATPIRQLNKIIKKKTKPMKTVSAKPKKAKPKPKPLTAAERREKLLAKYRRYEVEMDPIEQALQAVMMSKQLKREEHRMAVHRLYAAEIARRNQIARSLNLGEKVGTMTGARLLEFSDTPENVYIVYSRSGVANVFSKAHPEPGACTFVTRDASFTSAQKNCVFSVFINIRRASHSMMKVPPKVTPAWLIIVPSTSRITDMAFADKLSSVPSDVGAVGAFGYEYFLPDGSWAKCPATYGMYNKYGINMEHKGLIVGSRGYNTSNEVCLIDGPFIAIRGTYAEFLKHLDEFTVLGTGGQAYVNAAISMMMHRLGIKMMQIPVECSMNDSFEVPVGSLGWNNAENMLIKFGNTKSKLDI